MRPELQDALGRHYIHRRCELVKVLETAADSSQRLAEKVSATYVPVLAEPCGDIFCRRNATPVLSRLQAVMCGTGRSKMGLQSMSS